MDVAKLATRRRHGPELKARVLAECSVPGASVAAIALAHGLNANLVHRWRRLAARGSSASLAKLASPCGNEPRFVAVPLPEAPASPPPDIRIELRHGRHVDRAELARRCRSRVRRLARRMASVILHRCPVAGSPSTCALDPSGCSPRSWPYSVPRRRTTVTSSPTPAARG